MNAVIAERPLAPASAVPSIQPDTRLGTSIASTLSAEYLTFRLGDEEYGIDILRVQEIRSYESPTRIAGAPHGVLGVVNLRGVIVPIVDLRLQMEYGSSEPSASMVVIVLHLAGRVIGTVVDAVSDVVALPAGSIKPAPALSASGATGHIIGIGCVKNGDAERMLILTDIAALLRASNPDLLDGPAD